MQVRSSLRGPQQNLVSGFDGSRGSAAGRSALRRWGSSCWRTGFATFGFGGAGGGEQTSPVAARASRSQVSKSPAVALASSMRAALALPFLPAADDEIVEGLLRVAAAAAVHGAVVAAALLEHLLHLSHERGALLRVEGGRRDPGALLGVPARGIGGGNALRLVLAPLLGLELGLALRRCCRLSRLLPSPLGIEVGLALAGCRCLLLATLLGVERSLALGGCRRFLLSPRGVGRR